MATGSYPFSRPRPSFTRIRRQPEFPAMNVDLPAMTDDLNRPGATDADFQGFGTLGATPEPRGDDGFLRAVLAGLAAQNQRGDYLGAFQAGLGGALGSRQADVEAERESERERLARDLQERLYGLKERDLTEEIRHNQATEGREAAPRAMSELDLFREDPEAYRRFVVAGTKPDQGGPDKDRLVQIAGPNGTAVWVRESDAVGRPAAQAARSVTGIERSALAYYNRAKSADDSVTTPDQGGTSLEDRMARQSLMGQTQLRYAPNIMQTPEQQVYRQAQRAFTEARLRKESGAAIPLHEVESDARVYFAQPGDSPQTIAAKRQARQVVLNGLKFSSGRAFDEYYGGPAGGPGPVGSASDKDPLGIR